MPNQNNQVDWKEEEIYAFKNNKDCVFVDHTPTWVGDCYACSECGLKFVSIISRNKLIEQTLHQEREKAENDRTLAIREDIDLAINSINNSINDDMRTGLGIARGICRKYLLQPTNNTKEERCGQIIDKGGTYNTHCYNIKPCPIHNTKETK